MRGETYPVSRRRVPQPYQEVLTDPIFTTAPPPRKPSDPDAYGRRRATWLDFRCAWMPWLSAITTMTTWTCGSARDLHARYGDDSLLGCAWPAAPSGLAATPPYEHQLFKQIGTRYGPFNLAAVPIGAYNPRWFMQWVHVDPEEAVAIHEDSGPHAGKNDFVVVDIGATVEG
eukprot:jgi/Tetstr1/443373/TSEL_031388.t1